MAGQSDTVRGEKYTVQNTGKGFLRVDWHDDVIVEETDAQEVVDAIYTLNNGVSRPLLVQMASMRKISRPGRTRFSQAQAVNKLALVVRTALSRTVGSFFMGLNKHLPFETKLFTDETEAINWLLKDEQ